MWANDHRAKSSQTSRFTQEDLQPQTPEAYFPSPEQGISPCMLRSNRHWFSPKLLSAHAISATPWDSSRCPHGSLPPHPRSTLLSPLGPGLLASLWRAVIPGKPRRKKKASFRLRNPKPHSLHDTRSQTVPASSQSALTPSEKSLLRTAFLSTSPRPPHPYPHSLPSGAQNDPATAGKVQAAEDRAQLGSCPKANN